MAGGLTARLLQIRHRRGRLLKNYRQFRAAGKGGETNLATLDLVLIDLFQGTIGVTRGRVAAFRAAHQQGTPPSLRHTLAALAFSARRTSQKAPPQWMARGLLVLMSDGALAAGRTG